MISHGPDSARSRPGVNSEGTARQAVGRDRPTSAARDKPRLLTSSIPFGPTRPALLGIRAVLRSSPSARGHCATASALAGERTTKTRATLTSAGPMGFSRTSRRVTKTFASYLPVRALPHRTRNDAARGAVVDVGRPRSKGARTLGTRRQVRKAANTKVEPALPPRRRVQLYARCPS